MEGYQTLMFIFAVGIFLEGLYIYYAKNPYIPRTYHKVSKAYQRFVGKTTMFIALALALSIALTFITENGLIIGGFTVGLIILVFYLANKYFDK